MKQKRKNGRAVIRNCEGIEVRQIVCLALFVLVLCATGFAAAEAGGRADASLRSAASAFVPSPRVWPGACGDGRIDNVIDDFENLSQWSVCCSDNNLATVELRAVKGCSGKAMAIDYDLNGSDWIVVWRAFDHLPLNLAPFTHLRLAMHGTNLDAHHNVQVKLVDNAQNVRWYVGESIADLPVWRVIYIDLRALTCFGDAATCRNPPEFDITRIVRVEIGIARCLREVEGVLVECEGISGDDNVVHLDELAVVDLRPGAPNRFPPGQRERVQTNRAILRSMAATLRSRQEFNGLVPAWYDEATPNYNTYAQALRILVLAREPQTVANRSALHRAVTAMLSLQVPDGQAQGGAWFTWYRWDDTLTRFVPRDNCTGDEISVEDIDRCAWIGNVGWMLIALNRVKAIGGYPDQASLDLAIGQGGDWIVRQLGRLPDFGDVATYGLEGNISAYFGLLAADRKTDARRLADAIYRFGWDPVEQRMKIGIRPTDLGTAMDTAGSWGAEFLRCIGKERDARASQTYVASVMRTTSFDGTVNGYGDLDGPWTMTVEFAAQAYVAGIPGGRQAMAAIYPLQADDGSFPGSTDNFLGAGAWTTTWHGIAPTAWVYFAQTGSPLAPLCKRKLGANILETLGH